MSDDHALLQLLQAQLLHLAQQPAQAVDRPAEQQNDKDNSPSAATATAATNASHAPSPAPSASPTIAAPQPQNSHQLQPPLQPMPMRRPSAGNLSLSGARSPMPASISIGSNLSGLASLEQPVASSAEYSLAASSSPIASASHHSSAFDPASSRRSSWALTHTPHAASPFAPYSLLQQPTIQQQQQQQQIQLQQQAQLIASSYSHQHQLAPASAAALPPPTIMSYGPGAHAQTHMQYAFQSQPNMQYAGNGMMPFAPQSQYMHPLSQLPAQQQQQHSMMQQYDPSSFMQHPLSFLPQQSTQTLMSQFQPSLAQQSMQLQSQMHPLQLQPPLQTQPQSQQHLPLAMSAVSSQPFNGAPLPVATPINSGINSLIGGGSSSGDGSASNGLLMPALEPASSSSFNPLAAALNPLATAGLAPSAGASSSSASASAASASGGAAGSLLSSSLASQQQRQQHQQFNAASAAAAMFGSNLPPMFDAASFAAGAASVTAAQALLAQQAAQSQLQGQGQSQALQSPPGSTGDLSLLPLLQLNFPFPLVMQPVGPSSKRSRGVGTSCHQCKLTRATSSLYFCTNLSRSFGHRRTCKKKFCHSCMKRLYPSLIPAAGSAAAGGGTGKAGAATAADLDSWLCPSCHEMCVCSGCASAREEEMERKADAQARADRESAKLNAARAAQLLKKQQWSNGPSAAPMVSSTSSALAKSAAVAVSAPSPSAASSPSSVALPSAGSNAPIPMLAQLVPQAHGNGAKSAKLEASPMVQ